MSFLPTASRPYCRGGFGGRAASHFRGLLAIDTGQGRGQGRGQVGSVVYRSPGGLANWQIIGVTRDSAGLILPFCIVDLFVAGSDQLRAAVTSDALGQFTFANPGTGPFYLVAYKQGSPDVAGTTVNTLMPEILPPI